MPQLRHAAAGAFALLLLAAPQRQMSDHEAYVRQLETDFPNLARYAYANSVDSKAPHTARRVVFLGDSITENWEVLSPDFFRANGFVGRGIATQTSSQVRLRLHPDALALQPQAVHILVGINDILGFTGRYSADQTRANIAAMTAEVADSGAKVIIGTVPPAGRIPWRPGLDVEPETRDLNEWLRELAASKGYVLADYAAALSDPSSTYDGVHPRQRGYDAMEPIALEAIEQALGEDGLGRAGSLPGPALDGVVGDRGEAG